MSNWKIGDKAVCIDAGPSKLNKFARETRKITKGTMYLVTEVMPLYQFTGLRIAGHHVIKPNGTEGYYLADRFRKIVPRSERETLAEEHPVAVS